jgi:hypothetical protein
MALRRAAGYELRLSFWRPKITTLGKGAPGHGPLSRAIEERVHMHLHLSRTTSTRLSALLCLVGLGWILSSCGSNSMPVGFCAAPRSEAVEISVRDSTSGLPAADGALGTLVGAGVDDTLEHVDSLRIRGGDQTGTYVVTIDRPGFRTWSASNVHVTNVGPCGNVIPVEITALLQPATP